MDRWVLARKVVGALAAAATLMSLAAGSVTAMADPAPTAPGADGTSCESAGGLTAAVSAGNCSYDAATAVLTFEDATATVSGTTTTTRIVTKGTTNLTLNGANITSNQGSPIEVNEGTLNLRIDGTNVMDASQSRTHAGIQVNEGRALNVDGDGSLTAYGGWQGAGIGSSTADGRDSDLNAGTMTFNGGTVTATGGYTAAGIGCSTWSQSQDDDTGPNGGTVVINGGVVNAIGGEDGSAGIGASAYGDGATVLITGGIVNAVGNEGAAGIGSGLSASGGAVTILGGLVSVASHREGDPFNNNFEGSGIGSGFGGDSSHSSFSTVSSDGRPGNAVIVINARGDSPGIGDTSNQANWSGVFFDSKIDNGNGRVYGSPSPDSFEIPSGKTLVVPDGSTLNLKQGAVITNSKGSTVSVEKGGSIAGNGGSFSGDGAYKWQGPDAASIAIPEDLTWNGENVAQQVLDAAKTPAQVVRGGKQFATSFADGWLSDSSPSLEFKDGETWKSVSEVKAVGSYRLKFSKSDADPVYSSEFEVSKASSSLETTVRNGDKESNDFTYGDTITVKATPKIKTTTRAAESPGTGEASLYAADNQTKLAGPVKATDGKYVLTYDTSKKNLAIGEHDLLVEFGGDDNLDVSEGTVSVKLSARQLSGASVDESDASASKTEDGTTAFTGVRLLPVTGEVLSGDEVSLSADGDASSATAGTHKFMASTVTVAGADAGWYASPALDKVTGNVTITAKTDPDPDPEPGPTPDPSPEPEPEPESKPGPGGTTVPGGSTTNPDGSVTVPGSSTDKGEVTLPGSGGTVTVPGGSVVNPDGSVTIPGKPSDKGEVTLPGGGGTVTVPGGSVVNPDGSVTVPGGADDRVEITLPGGGIVVVPGGSVVNPDGTVTPPTLDAGPVVTPPAKGEVLRLHAGLDGFGFLKRQAKVGEQNDFMEPLATWGYRSREITRRPSEGRAWLSSAHYQGDKPGTHEFDVSYTMPSGGTIVVTYTAVVVGDDGAGEGRPGEDDKPGQDGNQGGQTGRPGQTGHPGSGSGASGSAGRPAVLSRTGVSVAAAAVAALVLASVGVVLCVRRRRV